MPRSSSYRDDFRKATQILVASLPILMQLQRIFIEEMNRKALKKAIERGEVHYQGTSLFLGQEGTGTE